MGQFLAAFLVIVAVLALALPAQAAVQLYVDSAPNAYGSPDWAPWWTQAKADIAAGTFTNMRAGTHPGTTDADPYDEIVYSTGDLGKRLHWIYWIPGETIADLDGRLEVKWTIDWAGTDYTYEGSGWAADGPEVGWSQPGSWEDYSGGVIGSLGFAWWATDNDALPGDTGGNPYDETDQADVDALREIVLDAQTYALGQVRIRENIYADWVQSDLNVDIVGRAGSFDVIPEPASIAVWSLLGALGLAWGWRRRKRAA